MDLKGTSQWIAHMWNTEIILDKYGRLQREAQSLKQGRCGTPTSVGVFYVQDEPYAAGARRPGAACVRLHRLYVILLISNSTLRISFTQKHFLILIC